MYKHILIPLDGSHLAEQVLPHATNTIAVKAETRITLLRSVLPIYPVTTEYGGTFIAPLEEIDSAKREAIDYLDAIAVPLRDEGYHVDIVVKEGSAAETIVDYAEHHAADLIAIATHGRSGISRWVFGSVTHKVLHATTVPMLVVRPVHEDA
jgi:nucleotide-binding universal stress UspA family protein